MPEELTYRGCKMTRCPAGWQWVHEDTFDAECDEGTWRSTGAGYGRNLNECREDIDEYLDSLETSRILNTIREAGEVCNAHWNASNDVVWQKLSLALEAIHRYIRKENS